MILLLRSFAGIIDLSFIGALSTGTFYLLQHILGMNLPPRYWNYWDYLVDIINQHPDFLWLALLAFLLVTMGYLLSGIFLRGSLGLFLMGLEIHPLDKGFKCYLRLLVRFFMFILFTLLAGTSLSGIILTGGRKGPHDWLLRTEVRKRVWPVPNTGGDDL